MNLKPASRREITFLGIGSILLVASVIGALFVLPEISQLDSDPRSEKSKHVKDPYGYPDKFIEYFEAAEGLDVGYKPYPHGHKIREFQKALQKKRSGGRSVDLDWVERGPGTVGGRTRAVVMDPTDPQSNTWYVASVGGGVWKARRFIDEFDQEKIEWTPLTDHLPSLAATALDMSRNNPDVMYLGTGEGFGNIDASGGQGMFKTTDRGQTWTHLPRTSVAGNADWRYINRLAVHPDNPDIVVVATNEAIFRTEDGGQTFLKVYDASDRVQDLRANPNNFNIQFATVNSVAILRSTDGGKTWKESLAAFPYPPLRIEIAISQSDPNVIWASAEGSGGGRVVGIFNAQPIADLYRSIDGGNSWRFIDRSEDTNVGLSAFLGSQGWYDNSILVHPFSPDTVYLGGIIRYKAWVDGDSEATPLSVGTVNRFNNTADFMDFVVFTGGNAAGRRLSLGFLNSDAADDVQEIEIADMRSVEIRFGPGLTQKAHRFTVPPNGGTASDGGAGINLPEYVYADYVEVPFQVWDTDANRQLMVSFRDQARDGGWSLIARNTAGPGVTHSREYVLISKYVYKDSAPHPDLAANGGLRKGLMYFFWPILNEDDEATEWNPNAPSPGVVDIDFTSVEILKEQYDMETWENGNVHVDHHALVAVPAGNNEFHILNGNDGGFAYSRDGGETWREGDASAGYNTSQFYDATKRPGFEMYLGGMQDNGTWASYNKANNRRGWRDMLGGDGFDVIWNSADSLMGSIQGNNIRRSLNGGTSWSVAGNIGDWSGQFLTSLAWTPKSGRIVFSLSPAAGPLRSTDFGNSWHVIHRGWQSVSGYSGKVRLSLADPRVLWGGYNMRTLYVSENALNPLPGERVSDPVRMRRVSVPGWAPTSTITGLATHPFARATAYVMFSASCLPKLARTEDMGRTWENLSGFDDDQDNCESSNGFPNAKVWDLEVFPDKPKIIWAGTDLGLFESRDHGETWAYADNGLPAVSIWRLRIIDDEIILATHGRGVWTLNIAEVQTASEEEASELPNSFELRKNYPNPFNPTTNISFRVAENSHVRVTVFDVLGRKVATLADQQYTRGTHQVQWNASSASSGQYIYRMEANGKVIGAKSMILVK